MLKHYAANRKRQLSALPNVGPYTYIYIYIYDVKISGFTRAPYIYDISRLRVKLLSYVYGNCNTWLKNEVLVSENERKQKYLYASDLQHLKKTHFTHGDTNLQVLSCSILKNGHC
jgi:hypothetical protein